MDAAFRVLDSIELDNPQYGQTAANLRRVGYVELVEALARDDQAAAALRAVDSAHGEYAAHRDAALGAIAVVQAERSDAAGAKRTLKRLADARTPYDYELQVALYLNDKAWGRRLIGIDSEYGRRANAAFEKLAPGDLHSSVFLEIALAAWCGERERAERYMQKVLQVGDIPDDARQELEQELEKMCKPDSPWLPEDEDRNRKVRQTPAAAEILAKLAAARAKSNFDDRAEALLAVATLLFESRKTADAASAAAPPPVAAGRGAACCARPACVPMRRLWQSRCRPCR